MNEINGKKPIVNGSVNKQLTVEEMLQFDFETKKNIAWSLKVGADYAHTFSGQFDFVREVFEPLKYPLQSSEITCGNVDQHIRDLVEAIENQKKTLIWKSSNYLQVLGREFYEANRRFGIKGEFEMPKDQLFGYIEGIGNSNDFYVSNVKKLLNFVEETAPRMNYGDNNPNTGNKQHKFSIRDWYIFVRFPALKSSELLAIKSWFKEIEVVGRQVGKADSVQLIVNDFEYEMHDATVYFWWD